MVIRKLSSQEIYQAILIHKLCWDLDYKNLVPCNSFDIEKKYQEVLIWVNDTDCQDIRKMYGAFINDKLIGFIGASLAEVDDSPCGVEVNYLFIEPHFRNQAIGLKLIFSIVSEYYYYQTNELIIYSLHKAKSNQFYRTLNPVILRTDIQDFYGFKNQVDVFKWNLEDIIKLLKNKLYNRSYDIGGYGIDLNLNEKITMTTKCDSDDYDNVCRNLMEYNVINTDGILRKPKVDTDIYLKDQGKIVGAIFCDTFNYSLYIDVFWIHDDYRNKGYGKKLIQQAEEIAKANGCIFAQTSTFSYQSPDFYQACGYEIFATLDDYPNNIVQFFLKKKL